MFKLCSILCALVLILGSVRLRAEESLNSELASGWRLMSAATISAGGATISTPAFDAAEWFPIQRMPATVLEVLEEDGVYPNLYFGMNLLTEVPQDLYRQDWWYRVSFAVPPGREVYWLEFPGINYRAEIWLNGKKLADNQQVAGMYVGHEFNVSQLVKPGAPSVVAVRVTPERAIPDVSGVELGDSWHDWLDWKYLGSKAPRSAHYREGWTADRNAGVFKPVYLHATGAVKLSGLLVNTDLPLPATSPARLAVFATVTNGVSHAVTGVLMGAITREGKPSIRIQQTVTLAAGEERELNFAPGQFAQLVVDDPDLWWPYTMGNPNLYNFQAEFTVQGEVSDTQSIQFGIRKVTQHRDQDLRFSKTAEGNLYLQVNGKDFPVRGANYTPDLLFRNDPQRNEDTIRYVKDLGLNMLRWEAKIVDPSMFELADKAGIPVMVGWMCCPKWEQWSQWNAEDQQVARASLRSQIRMLRAHASAFLWSNGSDGRPPEPLRSDYRGILGQLHWQNAVVDTDANGNKDAQGKTVWDGIGMAGSDWWHPPSYWFDPKYPASGGSTAEYGDNEVIPPYESLKKFIPPEKLWPINEYWFFHAGAHDRANRLETIRQVVERRYGASAGAEEFARKAQLAHYENTRAQFESWAANGWATHKIEMYWMLNNHWPSFFGHLYDDYMEPGGAYYGAKKGLQPLSVVFDYFASGDHATAHVNVTNQTSAMRQGLRVRVRIYDMMGKVRFDQQSPDLSVASQGVAQALNVRRPEKITSAYFVRCQLFDATGAGIVDNVYWQSTTLDDFGKPQNDDDDYKYKLASWSDFKALNAMPRVELNVSGALHESGERTTFSITLHNASNHVAFFERASVTAGSGGPEVLPIVYSDNYVTVFPGETLHLTGSFAANSLGGVAPWLRVEGYNTPATSTELQ
jgi:exo-1,4-beta-D-glucosaminidase